MRRRKPTGRALTPDELVALRTHVETRVAHLPVEDRSAAMRARLAEAGTNSLECIWAEYWIRRGRPAHYSPAIEMGWVP
ncbi:hypothetical protein [Humibacillus xanthopallidus]|uniref:Uncharacterized protein n=1 Tax=Humibacillus xanthopallidus TaxID=412689 RepID=A0A543HX71_9MICO|nr:hypothetical protein [Humibacillus xanthopallidus]TQM62942.1 hypothetical protein FBY41_2987 [Humibacillus xanthopallidus]